VAISSLATAIALIPAGILSDRFSRRKMIIIGGFTTIITLALRSIIVNETGLLTTAFIEGLFVALIHVSFIPLLSENSTDEQRVHLFSLLSALSVGASVIGNIGGGALTDLLQKAVGFSELISLRITLLVSTGIIALAIIPMLMIKENKAERRIKSRKKSVKFNLKEFYRKNKTSLNLIFLLSIAQLFIGFGAGLVIPYLNLYFSDRFEASKSTIGLIVSLGQAATAVAMFLGPMIVKRYGEVKSIVLLQLASIPFLLLTGLTQNLWLASIGYLLRQALMNAGNPIMMSVMMSRVDNHMRGLANSIGGMIPNIGWALMGPVSTSIVQANGSYWGYVYVFSITAFLYICGTVYFYLVFGTKKSGIALRAENRPL
jgi:MFS family permease